MVARAGCTRHFHGRKFRVNKVESFANTSGASHDSSQASHSAAQAKAVYRKIALRIVPLAVLGYVIAYIDRVNVGFAKLQFQSDLGFSDAVYGLGAGLFFAGYFFFEVPSNLMLERFGARATFARIMVLWGGLSAAMALIATPMQFYVMRFLLGMAEAGFFPGIILYFSFWFPAKIRGRVTGLFAMGASIAGVVGSPLSGWLMSLDGLHGLRGWQILFIYEGLPAVFLGLIFLLFIANKPEDARWLNAAERKLIQDELEAERNRQPETARAGSKFDAFRDPKVYGLALSYLSILAATQAVALWTPSLLHRLNVPTATIGLLTAIPYVIAMTGTYLLGRSSDYFQERRWHFVAAMTAAGVSLAVVGLVPASVVSILAFMSVVATGSWAALAVFWTIPPAYLSEKAKAAGIAFISSAGALGGLVSPIIIGWSSSVGGSIYYGLAAIGLMLLISAVILLTCMRKTSVSAGH